MTALDDIAAQITDTLTSADILTALAVRRSTFVPNPETPWDPSSGTTEELDHACSGWVDTYAQSDVNGSTIQQGDRRVFILASTLDIEPTTADHVPLDGSAYGIVSVGRDPAGAAWVLQCRL